MPRPGPISTTRSPGPTFANATIFSAMRGAVRKHWPSDFRGRRSVTARKSGTGEVFEHGEEAGGLDHDPRLGADRQEELAFLGCRDPGFEVQQHERPTVFSLDRSGIPTKDRTCR